MASKPIRLSIAKVARAILRLQEASPTEAAALLVDRSGHFEVWCAPDTERPWLAVGYSEMTRGSKRAANRCARRLINLAAAHLARYPNRFNDSIARVREL